MDISSVKVNSAAIEQGRWVGNLPDLGDIEVKVRGIGNPDYRRLQQAMIRALPANKRRNGVIDPIEMDRIHALCLHKHALLDWKNVEEKGAALPYSADQAQEFLTNPDYRKFRDGVFTAAVQVEDEVSDDDKAMAKN